MQRTALRAAADAERYAHKNLLRRISVRLLRKVSGYEVDYIPNISFRLMSLVLSMRDILFPVGKRLNRFGIRRGSVVVDFGCGTGSYLERASQIVGDAGKVYAVDVHPLAIMSIKRRVKQKNLSNVVPVLSTDYPVDIESQSADVIYALDMFHHVKITDGFLAELHRLLKPKGFLFIESGHQPLRRAREKLLKSGCWVIVNEEKNLFECAPNERGSA
jgi:ubiquinone/menaquinone biosynthesis C-methylase UbiE